MIELFVAFALSLIWMAGVVLLWQRIEELTQGASGPP